MVAEGDPKMMDFGTLFACTSGKENAPVAASLTFDEDF